MGEKRKGNQSGNLSTVKMTATDEKRKSERDKGKDYGFSEDDPFLQVGDGVEERRDGEGSFASGGYRRNVTGFFFRGVFDSRGFTILSLLSSALKSCW